MHIWSALHVLHIHKAHSTNRSFLSVFQIMDFQGLVITKSMAAVPAPRLIIPGSALYLSLPCVPLSLHPLLWALSLHTLLCTPSSARLCSQQCHVEPLTSLSLRSTVSIFLFLYWGKKHCKSNLVWLHLAALLGALYILLCYSSLVCILEFLQHGTSNCGHSPKEIPSAEEASYQPSLPSLFCLPWLFGQFISHTTLGICFFILGRW